MILEINISKRRSHCHSDQVFNVCRAKKYAARSEFCSVALLFSRLVHCRRRVLELVLLPPTRVLDMQRFR